MEFVIIYHSGFGGKKLHGVLFILETSCLTAIFKAHECEIALILYVNCGSGYTIFKMNLWTADLASSSRDREVPSSYESVFFLENDQTTLRHCLAVLDKKYWSSNNKLMAMQDETPVAQTAVST